MEEKQLGAGRQGDHRGLPRFLVILGFVAVSLAVLEGLAYLVFKVAGFEPYTLPVIVNPHHPFLGWVHAPNVTVSANNCGGSKSLIETDANGFAKTPFYSFENPELRIVVTGGSSVFGVGKSSNATTVSSVLEKLIVEKMGIRAEVYSTAVRGYQSFQEMLSLLRFSAIYDFDLALSIAGHNDARIAAEEQVRMAGMLPGNPHRASNFVRRAEREEFILRDAMSALRSCCYIFDLLAHVGGIGDADSDGHARTPKRLPSSKRRPREPDFSDVRQRAEMTLMNYAIMDQIARQKGAEFMMVLQPNLYTTTNLTKAEQADKCLVVNPDKPFEQFKKEYQMRFYKDYVDMDKPYRFIDARDAMEAGTVPSGSEDDVYFIDHGHLNDRGAEVMANYLFEKLRPEIERIMARKAAATSARTPPGMQPRDGEITREEDELAGRAAASD
jgi:hypothetical protein